MSPGIGCAPVASSKMDEHVEVGVNSGQISDEYWNTEWKSVSLTHVEYPKGDVIGLVLAWCSLLPIFLLVSFGTLVVFRRDLHTISFLAGIVIDEVINWILKHSIKEPRPVRGRENLYTEYGMPSSHSQFMWFFSTYLLFFLFIRVHHNLHAIDNLWKYLTALCSFIAASLVSYSRVYLGYHTISQVAWGTVAGACMGTLWFTTVQLLLTPTFYVIASWRISELFMIRDSTLIPNVMWFEYTSQRNESRSRQRKITARKSQ